MQYRACRRSNYLVSHNLMNCCHTGPAYGCLPGWIPNGMGYCYLRSPTADWGPTTAVTYCATFGADLVSVYNSSYESFFRNQFGTITFYTSGTLISGTTSVLWNTKNRPQVNSTYTNWFSGYYQDGYYLRGRYYNGYYYYVQPTQSYSSMCINFDNDESWWTCINNHYAICELPGKVRVTYACTYGHNYTPRVYVCM
jgi:hypothetical protein